MTELHLVCVWDKKKNKFRMTLNSHEWFFTSTELQGVIDSIDDTWNISGSTVEMSKLMQAKAREYLELVLDSWRRNFRS